ncbi:autotransporter domain-containing protein [Phenylobacterium sp.]|uniref:autotransporter domain-containing protein n=1 Tax=Phenylobacterium sp. TaxID=1871053 RepID=UPI0025CC20FD|nr:autotransporter domain-containing protein [Phenylobacterium sp.]
MTKLRRSVLATLMLSTCLATAATAQEWGDPTVYQTDEFWMTWGLPMINADYAYAQGVDGSGVKVGVVDSGITVSSELRGQVAGGYDYVLESPVLVDPSWHGTPVSSIIVGRRDGVGMHGVAPGAQVVNARILDEEGWMTSPPIVARAWNDLLDQGVRIINNSWGAIEDAATDFTALDVERMNPELVAGARSSVDRGALMIFITHNNAMDQANIESAYPYYFPELERGWLAVTAVGFSGDLASYANACGVAMNWCLAAPGGDIRVDGFGVTLQTPDDQIVGGEGTSFAAPYVSGAAALVWQKFPHFTTDQVRQTLLGTATDIGAPGVDDVYGYGLLNAGKAVGGPGRFDWGDFVVAQPGGVSNWLNDIAGDGGLTKQGDGTLVLYGDSSYAGRTQVLGGTLVVQGSIASEAFVGERGGLSGVGTIYGSVRNEGRLGGEAGPLTVTGDLELAPSSRVLAAMGPMGAINSISVGGAVRIEGGVVETQLTPGLYRNSYTQSVVTADGGVSGAFAAVEGAKTAFLSTSLSYQDGAVNLTLRRLAFDDASVCTGGNQCAVAGAIERGLVAGDEGFIAGAAGLQHADVAAARRSFASLSAQAYGSLAALALNGDGGIEPALGRRLGDGGEPGTWMRAQAGWGRLDGDQDASGADHRRGGVAAGRDWRLTPELIAGVSFGYDDLTAEFDDFGARGKVQAYEAAAYGRVERGRFGVGGWLSYGRLDSTMRRELALADETRLAWSKYDGTRAMAFAEAAYDLDVAGAMVSPLASLRYGRIDQGGFTERGGEGLGLVAQDMTLESWRTGLGVRAAADLQTARSATRIEGQAVWLHELGDEQAAIDAAFTGASGAGFTSRSVALDRDSLSFGMAVTTRVGKAGELFASFDTRLAKSDSAQSAAAGLRFSW